MFVFTSLPEYRPLLSSPKRAMVTAGIWSCNNHGKLSGESGSPMIFSVRKDRVREAE